MTNNSNQGAQGFSKLHSLHQKQNSKNNSKSWYTGKLLEFSTRLTNSLNQQLHKVSNIGLTGLTAKAWSLDHWADIQCFVLLTSISSQYFMIICQWHWWVTGLQLKSMKFICHSLWLELQETPLEISQ